jgi:hypothetical protein
MLERFDAEAAAQWHECIRIQLVKRLGKRAADGLVLATHIRWFGLINTHDVIKTLSAVGV